MEDEKDIIQKEVEELEEEAKVISNALKNPSNAAKKLNKNLIVDDDSEDNEK